MAEVYQCRACGGNVIPAPDGKTGICEYCGKDRFSAKGL